MASIIASTLGPGWKLVGPHTPVTRELLQGCNATQPQSEARCDPKCLTPRYVKRAQQQCSRCECRACIYCSPAENQWVSPSGQLLHSLTTRTEPPFIFAFNPLDPDMDRMRKHLVLEPALTHAWHEQTWKCCSEGGLVVDVGGNFGWFTLYSLALGCRVRVFEPVPKWHEILRLGVTLNPGFATRLTLYANVVYDTPGNFTLMVPRPRAGVLLGMTGMIGSQGLLKGCAASHST